MSLYESLQNRKRMRESERNQFLLHERDNLLAEITREAEAQIQEMKDVVRIAKESFNKIIQEQADKELPEEARLERLSSKIATKLSIIEKGDKGDDGEQGEVGPQGEKGEQGPKGERGRDGRDGESIVGPQGEKGKDGSPDSPDQVVEKINSAKIKIKKSAIEGLEEAFNNLRNTIRVSGRKLGGTGGGGGGAWYQQNLTGTINGSNTIFTFTGNKPAQYSERIFLNYTEQNPLVDYTINYSTKTITYTVAPDASLSGLPHIIRYSS